MKYQPKKKSIDFIGRWHYFFTVSPLEAEKAPPMVKSVLIPA